MGKCQASGMIGTEEASEATKTQLPNEKNASKFKHVSAWAEEYWYLKHSERSQWWILTGTAPFSHNSTLEMTSMRHHASGV